jgi:hypothetical protein
VRRLIEGPIGELNRAASLDRNVVAVLERRAVEDSADYIAAAMPQAEKRPNLGIGAGPSFPREVAESGRV